MNVLMCAPAHYDIRYEINPWMKMKNRITPAKASAQWKALRRTLEGLGVTVQTIAQRQNCPDMVFTANAGVVSRKRFIPSHFRYAERQPEEPAFISYFRRRGFTIDDTARGRFFEGEGDLLPYRDMYFGGFRFRSEIGAHEAVAKALGKRFIGLDLVQPRFYHLDTCFLPLDDRSVLYHPGAFDAYGRKVIRQFVEDPIAVSPADAQEFACNGIRIGRTVVLNKASRALKAAIAKRGYEAVETPTSEFMKAGGSVKCLLLRL
jgi:N-dimethylarginine dimethylaminohydrolase